MKMGDTVLRFVAKTIEKGAVMAAKPPSWHGWYEAKVPKKLLEKQKKDA